MAQNKKLYKQDIANQSKTFLLRALELARIRQGFTAPNPAVGAVIVKKNEIISEGYHWAAGYPHAEIEALKQVNASIADASLYVTLEPCSHSGKTPPCVEAIIKSGIKKVYYGLIDPNPKVSGKGIAKLQAAGIDCELIALEEIISFYDSYRHWWQTGLPNVIPKLAISLDGKLALEGGKPAAITSTIANIHTHELRKKADAILTTANTVICDNPRMNVRLGKEIHAKPVYILDQYLNTPLSAQLFNTTANLTLFHRAEIDDNKKQSLQNKGARCIVVSTDSEGLSLKEVMKYISEDGHYEVIVEAGGRCFQALINAGLAQCAYIYVAPIILGQQAISAFALQENIFAAAKTVKWTTMGVDAMCEMRF